MDCNIASWWSPGCKLRGGGAVGAVMDVASEQVRFDLAPMHDPRGPKMEPPMNTDHHFPCSHILLQDCMTVDDLKPNLVLMICDSEHILYATAPRGACPRSEGTTCRKATP